MNEISDIHQTESPGLREPETRIAKRAISMWRISALIASIVYMILPAGYYLTGLHEVLPSWVLWALIAVMLIFGLFQVIWWPDLRWKYWRYRIGEEEIDLQRGLIVNRRTLIPVRRVQHVDLRQGPLLRKFELATISITTAATTHEIPALDLATADKVRHSISQFARLAEDDV